jgi:hypothetical protein
MRKFMRVSGILAAILFLSPSLYAIKYAAYDSPRENKLIQAFDNADRASRARTADSDAQRSVQATLHDHALDNIPLLSKVAQQNPDAVIRRDAVITLGEILLKPSVSVRRPIEALQGKAALAAVASHDIDPEVQLHAQQAIDAIARNGAVLRR